MSKRSRACEFSPAERIKIYERQRGQCLFCLMGYEMDGAEPYELSLHEMMHVVPRSHGGLGIEQNGILGCIYHHRMLDNGSNGKRQEMLEICREYLKRAYPGYDFGNVIYKKGV
ncbi:MAG: hypothetical protein K5894_16365 [Lachnospiraceae bacterium]|nr:hypothetical protein [Lachnospiraceae bacterium]